MRALNSSISAGLFILIGGLFIASAAWGIQEMKYPQLNAKGSVEIAGRPETGAPFSVIFTFTIEDSIIHSKGYPDTARIRTDPQVQYIGGDTVLVGNLQAGREYQLSAQYAIHSPIRCRFFGSVLAMEALNKIERPLTAKEDDPPVAFPSYVAFRSEVIDLRPEPERAGWRRLDRLQVTDTGVVLVDSAPAPPRPELTLTPRIDPVPERLPRSNYLRGTREPQSPPKPLPTPIPLNDRTPDTIRIAYDPGRETGFHIGSTQTGPVEVKLVLGEAAFHRIGPLTGRFELADGAERAVFLVSVGLLERVLVIEKRSYYWINGSGAFEDPFFNLWPLANVAVRVFESGDGESWIWTRDLYTDSNGYFSFSASTAWVRFYFLSYGSVADVVWVPDHDFSPDDLTFWLHYHGTEIYNPTFVMVDVPMAYTTITDLSVAGAFSILDQFRKCQEYILSEFDNGPVPPYTGVVWDDLDGSRNGSAYGGFLYNGIPGFYISSRSSDSRNWDEWDLSVLCHEFGHHVQYHYMESIPAAGGTWNYLYPIAGSANADLAMSEGWALFFSCQVLNEERFLNTTVDDPNWIDRHLELPVPDPPFYHPNDIVDPLPPPRSIPQYNGIEVPGAVAVSFYDLCDNIDDDNYYVSGVLWGHNNDHNGWGVEPSQRVWDVLTNYDPAPADPNHDHCWTIREFMAGWDYLGYPVNTVFEDLFAAHAIDVLLWAPGDVNGDNLVTVSDLTRLIDYLFRGGPEPIPLLRGDVNGDCAVNVSDLSLLIAVLFRGAPAPTEACDELA